MWSISIQINISIAVCPIEYDLQIIFKYIRGPASGSMNADWVNEINTSKKLAKEDLYKEIEG